MTKFSPCGNVKNVEKIIMNLVNAGEETKCMRTNSLRKVVLKQYIILVLTCKYSKLLDGLFMIVLNFVLNVMKKMAGSSVSSTKMVLTCAFVIEQMVVIVKILNR